MSRKKKELELTLLEKNYIDLTLKTANNVSYEEVFKNLSSILEKPEDLIRNYANKMLVNIVDQQLPPEPPKKQLTPQQNMVRNMLIPNKDTEHNKARHVTVMSEMASEAIEKLPPVPIKGSSKTRDCIFRQ